MRQILILAVLLLGVGGYVAHYADQLISAKPPVQGAAVHDTNTPRLPVTSGRSLTLNANRQGHFEVEARVGGRPVDFIVDSGASQVTLRESAAARIGIRPQLADYKARVSTANGEIKAAPVRLERIEVGGITVYDVQALVLPDEALNVNLLGVAIQSRLKP
jgi:aspartyl protease family protein